MAQAATPYETAVLADSPLVYYRMADGAGATSAQDSSGHGITGTFFDATLGVAGPFTDAGAAASLPATGRVTADVPTVSGSAELWVNPQKLARGQEAGYIAHGNPKGDGWAIGIGAKRKLAFVTGGVRTPSKITIPAGTWTLIDATWTAKEVQVYVNGAPTKKLVNRANAAPASSRADLVVGGTGSGAFANPLVGKVDEVALYEAALSAGQVKAHFAAAHLPVNLTQPGIDGTPEVGQTLTAVAGAWSDATTYAYQWQRCDAAGDDCEDIAGATGTTYVLTADDVDATLQVVETASNTVGSSTAISDPRGPVRPVPTTGGGDGGSTGGGDGGSTGGGDGGSTGGTGTTGGTTGTTGGGTGTPIGGTPTPPSSGDPTGAPQTCLQVTRLRKAVKVRSLGRLKVRAARNVCLGAGAKVRFTFRGKKVQSVKVKLDGKRVKAARKANVTKVVIAATRLKAGRHTLVVRMQPKSGKAKVVRLRLRTAVR